MNKFDKITYYHAHYYYTITIIFEAFKFMKKKDATATNIECMKKKTLDLRLFRRWKHDKLKHFLENLWVFVELCSTWRLAFKFSLR